MTESLEPALADLAGAYGVAVSYQDSKRTLIPISARTIIDVLAALGVDASTPAGVRTALAQARRRVTPVAVDLPRPFAMPDGRTWGWMVQLYSVRSAGSWGMGDYRDLAEIVRWSGSVEGGGAGLVLCNPLHAMTPTHPVEDSPYYPSSRRFRSALYLRIEDIPEYAAAGDAIQRQVDALRPAPTDGLIDRDAVWSAKLAALEVLWPGARQEELDAFRADQGAALDGFGLFCALAEQHGPDWRRWPEELRDPAAAQAAAGRLGDRVRFHVWLQLLCDEQLATASRAAREAGMPVGIVHDLAVGVDPGGADAWALQEVLAVGATVGCPADSFNQLGQDWQLPPWDPTRLAEAHYQPFRDMVRSVLRHAGGIRIDHVMGLFRLWWIPDGNRATRGAYVTYDWRAMLGVLTEEARRAGAVVIGEDLGTVEARVTAALGEAGILGCDVAWGKRAENGGFQPPAKWRTSAIASVTTHDLPTIAGWFTDEAVRVRAELGQLDGPVRDELTRHAAERGSLLAMLRAEGLLPATADADDLVEIALSLHRLLVAAPAVFVVAALGDAVGDLRQPNLPGTRHEYPNWRLPVADGTGRAMSLEELKSDPRVHRLIEVFRGVSNPASGSGPASDTVTA